MKKLVIIMPNDRGVDSIQYLFYAEEIPEYGPPCNRIFEVQEDLQFEIGYLWNDGNPIPDPDAPLSIFEPIEPEPPQPINVEEAKAFKRQELTKFRDMAMDAGFTHNGNTFPLNPDVQLVLTQEFLATQAPQMAPFESYKWKNKEGIYVTIGDKDAFQAFCAAAMAYGKLMYTKEQILQEMVNNLDSIEAINAINWDTPIPGFPPEG